MQTGRIEHPKIEVHYNTAVEEVLGDAHVTGLRLRDTVTGRGATMAVEGLFIAIGHRPTPRPSATGSRSTPRATSSSTTRPARKIDGVFIAGDVHDHRYRQAVTAAGDGCKAAIDAERWLEAQGITEAATATAW